MGEFRLNRRVLGGALLGGWAAQAYPLLAQTPVPPQVPSLDLQGQAPFRADEATDRVGRSTVPVYINGQGPFRFVLDTAANASVVASDLAESLGIAPAGQLDMHTVIGMERVPAVRAETLSSGSLTATSARLAVGSRAGLIGVDGLLGLDLLAGQRLVLRFRGSGRSSINRTRPDPDPFLGMIRPRVQFQPPRPGVGPHLMLVNATVRGHAVRAVIDTGAQVSLINPALARAAGARPLVSRDAETGQSVQSPTGRQSAAEAMSLRSVHFDQLVLDRLAVLMGDFHIFRYLGLSDTPAMLLGVDVLGLFDRVVIDLARGEIIMDV